MRQILVEHARRRNAEKRGGGMERVTLDERMARVVELRAFGGMTAEETAQVLGVTSRTIQSDWRMAEMWLGRELEESSQP